MKMDKAYAINLRTEQMRASWLQPLKIGPVLLRHCLSDTLWNTWYRLGLKHVQCMNESRCGAWCHSCTSQNPQLRHHCTCQRCLPGPASFPQGFQWDQSAGLGSSCTSQAHASVPSPPGDSFNRGSNRRVSYHEVDRQPLCARFWLSVRRELPACTENIYHKMQNLYLTS